MQSINFKFFLFIAGWIFLSILFGLLDLAISQAIVDQRLVWAHLISDYGKLPAFAMINMSFMISISSIFREIKKQKIVGIIFTSCFIVFSEFAQLESIVTVISVISMGAFIILTFNKDWRKYVIICLVIIASYQIMLLSVDFFKVTWGRVRYRNLDSVSEYTPWFKINPGQKGRSFISGHTANL